MAWTYNCIYKLAEAEGMKCYMLNSKNTLFALVSGGGGISWKAWIFLCQDFDICLIVGQALDEPLFHGQTKGRGKLGMVPCHSCYIVGTIFYGVG